MGRRRLGHPSSPQLPLLHRRRAASRAPPLTSSSLFNVLEAKAEVMPAFRDWTNDCGEKVASEWEVRSAGTGGLGQKDWGVNFLHPEGGTWELSTEQNPQLGRGESR